MNKRFLLAFCMIFAFMLNAETNDVEVFIRLYDKKIYYPSSSILLKTEITNNGAETFKFLLSDYRTFNVDFTVKTLKNVEQPHSQQFIIQRNTNQPVFFREVQLPPGDQYSFIVDLQEYIAIGEAGVYSVQCRFFPDLYRNASSDVVRSNTLTFTVKPDMQLPGVYDRIEEATGELLRRTALPPDEVVEYLLHARQKNAWEMFFLYLDVENLLLLNPDRKRRYLRLSEADQITMLENFKQGIRLQNEETDFISVPDSFRIIKTAYTENYGTVQVDERFVNPDFTEIKRYTYYLKKENAVWIIYDYDVRNIGTE